MTEAAYGPGWALGGMTLVDRVASARAYQVDITYGSVSELWIAIGALDELIDNNSKAHMARLGSFTAGVTPLFSWETHYSSKLRRRSALPMTETELNVMAALAIIGLRSTSKNGYKSPAATGTPSKL